MLVDRAARTSGMCLPTGCVDHSRYPVVVMMIVEDYEGEHLAGQQVGTLWAGTGPTP